MKSKNDFSKEKLASGQTDWRDKGFVVPHFAKVRHDDIWRDETGSWSRMQRDGRFQRWLRGNGTS